jgi:gentisate 1,2-dioxygenase
LRIFIFAIFTNTSPKRSGTVTIKSVFATINAIPRKLGHAAVRFTNPTNGKDVLPTIRAEMHRVRRGAETAVRREVGSSVYQVFDGSGTVTIGDRTWAVTRGDMFVVPSWVPFSARSEASPSDSDLPALDLFRFSDAPIFEALHAHRVQVGAS